MLFKSLIPWSHSRRDVPVRRAEGRGLPMWPAEFERMFEDFLSDWAMTRPELPTWEGEFTPRMNVVERENEMVVTAEMPGMDEKDIEISVSDDTLTIQGEKKEEREESSGEMLRRERFYGKFRRDIPMMGEFDPDKAAAEFSKGVLTVKVPRLAEAQSKRKRIEVKSQ